VKARASRLVPGPAAAALWLAAAAGPAAAQSDHRFYLAASGGASVYDVDCRGSTTCDRVDRAGRAAAGVFVAPNLALEATFIDFGRAVASRGPDSQTWRLRLAGVGLAVPLDFGGPWSGLLRLGVASVRTVSDRGSGLAFSRSTGNSAEAYGGFAVAYALTPQVALELAYDSTRGEVNGTAGRVDALSFGVQLRF
jgi:hypothetical protein